HGLRGDRELVVAFGGHVVEEDGRDGLVRGMGHAADCARRRTWQGSQHCWRLLPRSVLLGPVAVYVEYARMTLTNEPSVVRSSDAHTLLPLTVRSGKPPNFS